MKIVQFSTQKLVKHIASMLPYLLMAKSLMDVVTLVFLRLVEVKRGIGSTNKKKIKLFVFWIELNSIQNTL